MSIESINKRIEDRRKQNEKLKDRSQKLKQELEKLHRRIYLNNEAIINLRKKKGEKISSWLEDF